VAGSGGCNYDFAALFDLSQYPLSPWGGMCVCMVVQRDLTRNCFSFPSLSFSDCELFKILSCLGCLFGFALFL